MIFIILLIIIYCIYITQTISRLNLSILPFILISIIFILIFILVFIHFILLSHRFHHHFSIGLLLFSPYFNLFLLTLNSFFLLLVFCLRWVFCSSSNILCLYTTSPFMLFSFYIWSVWKEDLFEVHVAWNRSVNLINLRNNNTNTTFPSILPNLLTLSITLATNNLLQTILHLNLFKPIRIILSTHWSIFQKSLYILIVYSILLFFAAISLCFLVSYFWWWGKVLSVYVYFSEWLGFFIQELVEMGFFSFDETVIWIGGSY